MTTWLQVREHYKHLMKQSRLKQEMIAEAGELHQSGVSKMLANTGLGPSVETFIRAVEGLGMPLSEFFASLERREGSVGRARPDHRQSTVDQRALKIGRAIVDVIQSQPRPRRPKTRRSA